RETEMITQKFIGLDLGRQQDFTALTVLTRPHRLHFQSEDRKAKPLYSLPHLVRFPLGTPYPVIVANVVSLLQTPQLRGALLVVDRTGVGIAVCDMFREAFKGHVTCRYCPVTITGGHNVSPSDGGGYAVPKKEL